jgi:hypothetical protein
MENGSTNTKPTLYAKRDLEELGKHYLNHLDAMTSEQLHSKSDLAAELAARDGIIEELTTSTMNKWKFLLTWVDKDHNIQTNYFEYEFGAMECEEIERECNNVLTSKIEPIPFEKDLSSNKTK